MAMGFSEDVRNARAQVFVDKMDAGSSAAVINFYNGVRPATGAALTTQTLLGTVTMGDPSGTVSGGVLTGTSTTQDLSVDNDGTLRWARILDSDGTFILDCDCGVAGSGASIIFNSVDALQGGILKVTSFTITEGNS